VNSTRFDLNLMTVLDVLLRERSVSRAAVRLNLSQPAVSHALARARDVFGDPLLVREGSVMRPTPLALRLEAPLSEVLGGVERMLQTTRRFDPMQLQGQVRIGMSDYADFLLLPPLLEHLRAHAPGLCILSRDMSSETVADELSTGQIDMAISFKLAHEPGIHERHLIRDRHVCLAPKPMRGAMTLDRYLAARHVQISYRGVFAGGADEALGRMGLARTVAVFTPHVMAAASTAARAGLVLTTPERLARSLVEIFPLKLCELPFDLPELQLTMAWHSRNDADAAQGWLRESIVAVAAMHGGAPTLATDGSASPGSARKRPR
jgi:LysR family transcriptional activator of mexEF-oprN operon